VKGRNKRWVEEGEEEIRVGKVRERNERNEREER